MIREIESLIAQDVASLEDINLVAQASYGMRHACIGHIRSSDMFASTLWSSSRAHLPELSNAKAIGDSPGEGGTGNLGVKTGRGWVDYKDVPGRKYSTVRTGDS